MALDEETGYGELDVGFLVLPMAVTPSLGARGTFPPPPVRLVSRRCSCESDWSVFANRPPGREDAPHTLFGNRAAARLGLGKPEEALDDAEVAIKKDPTWLKGYHRKACAHSALGDPQTALATYRQALDLEPRHKWLEDQVRQAKVQVVERSKVDPVPSLDSWVTVFESMTDSRERLSTLAHLWNQCEAQDRHHIFVQFLELIAGAGASANHTGVKAADFTEEMMVSLPMDNYEDLKPVETWMAFFKGLSRAEKVEGFKRMWSATEEKEKDVIVNDLRHFFLEPLLSTRATGKDVDEDDDDGNDNEVEASEDGGGAALSSSSDGHSGVDKSGGGGSVASSGNDPKSGGDSSESCVTGTPAIGTQGSGPGS